MALSLAELRAVVEALRPRLLGGQIQRIRQYDEEHLVLRVRGRQVEDDGQGGERPSPGPGVNWDLLFCVRPRFARVHPTWREPGERPDSPLAFDQRLRATLLDGRICDLATPWDDRVLVVDVRRGEARLRLLAELSGHHANVFLLDDRDSILATLRPNASRKRDLRVGHPYEPPVGRSGAVEDEPTGRGEALLRDLDARYARRTEEERRERRRLRLAKALRRERKRLDRLSGKLAGDLEKATLGEQWRERGELLKASLHQVRKGDSEARVIDWAAPQQAETVIPLDPALSPRDNLAALFGRYKKAQRGRPQIEARIAEAEGNLRRLRPLFEMLEDAEDDDAQLDALEAQVCALDIKLGRAGKPRPSQRRRESRHLPYRLYHASDGTEILVGKGGADNGTLTFRVARDSDLWLHVRDAAGAHVVVRAPKGRPASRETMIDAALLAAHFSKRRSEGRVEVHLTPKRHVRPIKGAPAGTVRVERSESLLVEMDAKRLGRLLDAR